MNNRFTNDLTDVINNYIDDKGDHFNIFTEMIDDIQMLKDKRKNFP